METICASGSGLCIFQLGFIAAFTVICVGLLVLMVAGIIRGS